MAAVGRRLRVWGEGPQVFQRYEANRKFLADCPKRVAEIFRHWEESRGERSMPRRADLGLENLVIYLPGITLVDIEGTDDQGVGIFRYSFVGAAEVSLRGKDPSGTLVTESYWGPSLEDVIGCYEFVRRQKSFLYDATPYLTPIGKFSCEATLFLPLSEDGVTVSQVLVYSIEQGTGAVSS